MRRPRVDRDGRDFISGATHAPAGPDGTGVRPRARSCRASARWRRPGSRRRGPARAAPAAGAARRERPRASGRCPMQPPAGGGARDRWAGQAVAALPDADAVRGRVQRGSLLRELAGALLDGLGLLPLEPLAIIGHRLTGELAGGRSGRSSQRGSDIGFSMIQGVTYHRRRDPLDDFPTISGSLAAWVRRARRRAGSVPQPVPA